MTAESKKLEAMAKELPTTYKVQADGLKKQLGDLDPKKKEQIKTLKNDIKTAEEKHDIEISKITSEISKEREAIKINLRRDTEQIDRYSGVRSIEEAPKNNGINIEKEYKRQKRRQISNLKNTLFQQQKAELKDKFAISDLPIEDQKRLEKLGNKFRTGQKNIKSVGNQTDKRLTRSQSLIIK